MVTLKKHSAAAKQVVKAVKHIRSSIVHGKLKKLDASSNGGVGKASLMQLKAVRRTDQRSAFSINGSSGGATRSTGGHTSKTNSGVTGASTHGSVRRPPTAASERGRRILTCKLAGYSGGGVSQSDFVRTNSGVSNSADPSTKAAMLDEIAGVETPRQARWGSKSYATSRGKTVSITASQDGRTLSSRLLMASNSEQRPMKRSIIKKRSQPAADLTATNNAEAAPQENKVPGCMTPHQIKVKKIFEECRFVPIDSFYKKVLIAPNEERQFFAEPKCSRIRGSKFIYDIAAENARHHHDVNIDFTRTNLRRVCSNYLRPSYFRQYY